MAKTDLEIFAGGDELAEFVEDFKPWEQERPIDKVSIEVTPKRKTLPTHMSSKLQLVLIAGAATSVILFVLWLLGVFKGDPSAAYTENEKIEMEQLRAENQQLKDQESAYQQEIGDKNLTANIVEFKGQTQQTPGKSMVNPSQATIKPAKAPARRPVRPQNTVTMPRQRSNASPPRSLIARRPIPRSPIRPPAPPAFRPPAQPSKPSLDSCVGYSERNISVPECASYRISKKSTATQAIAKAAPKPVTAPRPVAKKPVLKKPLKLAYAPKSEPAKSKADYEVNYLAGEIQTVDQFEQEFYGSGQTASAPQLSRMEAEVIDHIEWLSPEDAKQLTIPLKITSGPQEGQTAEAKITQINGVQFTAQVVSLNGQEIEPGELELRHKDTKFLRADLKRQGGESFGKRLLGTVAAIGGEVASDQLADVRGGNQISRLLPGQSRGQAETQFWRFDGKVEIVPVN